MKLLPGDPRAFLPILGRYVYGKESLDVVHKPFPYRDVQVENT